MAARARLAGFVDGEKHDDDDFDVDAESDRVDKLLDALLDTEGDVATY